MHMFIVESLEVMFYKYQSAIQLDFKTRDITNKHLKFRGKVRTGDTKLDFCVLIYWSKKGNIHLQTEEVSVMLETIQDKEFIYSHLLLFPPSSIHTFIYPHWLCVLPWVCFMHYTLCLYKCCTFSWLSLFISILSFIFYTQLNHCFLLNVFCDVHLIYSYILTLQHCVNLMEFQTCVRNCLVFCSVSYHWG